MRLNDDQRRRLAAKAKRIRSETFGGVRYYCYSRNIVGLASKGDCAKVRWQQLPSAPAGRERRQRLQRWSFAWRRRIDPGYRRIQGALANLGHTLAHKTVAAVLKRHGIEPAPERSRKTTWREFLHTHWDQIVASDFFTIEVWTAKGLQRFVVLFFIQLSTRRVEIGGIARQANGL